jgi:transposase
MGMKRAPAVRLCVTCEQLKSADQFAPGRYKCLACQSAGRRRRRRPTRTQHDPHASLHGRSRDQALRRLGREHLDAYRAHYQAQRREIPSTVPADLARKRAVNRALRALQRQHRLRYGELYQQELRRARSRRHLRGPGRPAGTSNRLTVRAEPASTWQPDGAGGGQSRQGEERARQRANLEAVRERASELFAEGCSAATVAKDLNVARQTATEWRARWQSGGAAVLRNRKLGRPSAVPDSQLPAIEQALLTGAAAHGFDSDRWTTARVAVVVQRITGVQLGRRAVQLLLRERLGWRFQPAPSGVTAHPLPTPASPTDPLAAVAAAALVNLGEVSAGLSSLARSSRPASPAERRDAIAQAWRDEPGITSTALAERFGVSRRTIQYDFQALQERGLKRRAPDRRRRSHRTRAQYAAIYRRFLAWLAGELGRPPTGQDLSGPPPAATVAVGCRRRRCGWNAAPCANSSATPATPSWPQACTPPNSRHSRRKPSPLTSMSDCWPYPTLRPRPECATGPSCGCWATSACVRVRCAPCSSATSSGASTAGHPSSSRWPGAKAGW